MIPRGRIGIGKNTRLAFLPDRCIRNLRVSLGLTSCLRSYSPGLLPKAKRNRNRIDIELIPPRAFVASSVELAMMNPAQRNRELIRHPTAESARLREPDVMGLARLPTAHRARLTGNKAQMVFVAAAPRLLGKSVGFYADS